MSATHGRLPHTKGKESKSKKYTGGTIFVDHSTSYIHHANQVSLRVGETLKAKNTFERFAKECGHTVNMYHADNAPFRAEEFVRDCTNKGQTVDYSGVGAHHQNGVAERAIRTVTTWARTMMLHQVLHWPTEARLDLWPFALNHAIYLWNHMPKRGTRMSPVELFTGSKFPNYAHLQRSHVWGCPVYVLDPTLQDGKKLPKWKPRARRGLYVGVSPIHSSTVGRVLNLNTGHVSDQYHCVYDDLFSTVNSPEGGPFGIDNFSVQHWTRLIESGYERHVEPEMDDAGNPIPFPEMTDDWLSGPERRLRTQIRRERQERRVRFRTRQRNPPERAAPHFQRERGPGDPLPRVERERAEANDNAREAPPVNPVIHEDAEDEDDTIPNPTSIDSEDESDFSDEDEADGVKYRLRSGREIRLTDDDEFERTRSGRRVIPPDKFQANTATYKKRPGFPGQNLPANPCGSKENQKVRAGLLNNKYLNSLNWSKACNMLKGGTLGAMWAELEQHTDQEHNTVEWMNPALFSVKANTEDNPTWDEAMNGENAEGYWQACQKEYETLLKMDVWEEVEREPWMNIIPSTWAFRCKRFPDGLVRKLKSRFCARGDKQIEGVDFFETYAPVVNWQTVRLMLVMSLLMGLSTSQVDYTAAFVHADIDKDPNWDNMTEEERKRSGVYINMPRGFANAHKVLKLKKSLYGLKQSPRNFFLHLKDKLEGVGFEQSISDQCLFISDKVVCLVYVDDTLFFAENDEDITEVIKNLQEAGMELEVEDDVAGFLGVHIDRRKDGTIHLTQTGLIDRFIKCLNIGDLPEKRTPAEYGCLGKDEDGDPPQGTYSYPSAIGMVQYVQGHTRPDITFAVSQCSRFTHYPRRSHERALERIGQYLKGTRHKGLILNPKHSTEFTIDCYVDADFAGMWGHEDKQDPSCVKSRTGFVIFLMDCPVIWTSKLQTDIATSTMESEYNSLSIAMRDVIPLQNLTREIIRGLGHDKIRLTTFKTTVHEDNTGALKLARMEPGRMTPRSKHYGIKYHWFRSKLKPNEVEIVHVGTDLQRADFLTKALRVPKFEENRKLTCGW
jgi:hypothetical protein